MAPTVSVVITTYNQAPYIAATIASVLDQTYRDFEIILVDDGSTDSTATKISPYRDRLAYIRQRNRGVPAARNVGISHASGRMIAFLDGDDLWEAEKLQKQMEAVDAQPRSGLVVTDGVEFAPDCILRTSLMNPSIVPLLAGRDFITLRCYEELIRGNLITSTSQVMVPRTVIDRVGLSDERFPISSDWDLYLRIAAVSDVTFLSQKLVRYRYLATSASGPRHLRQFRWGLDVTGILRKHVRLATRDMRPLVRIELARHTRAIAEEAYYYSLDTDRRWGRRYLFNVLLANPTSLSTSAYLLAMCAPRFLTRRFGRVMRRVLGWR
jgi:glycosyltransferase involved in cell wall biosynthesis